MKLPRSVLCSIGAVPLLAHALVAAEPAGPLAAYVAQSDRTFGWTERQRGRLGEAEFVELTLTSQTWHGTTWKHQLFVIKPKRVRNASRALLYIGGGRWRPDLATPLPAGTTSLPREAPLVAEIASQAGTPVAILLQVPQQPLFGGMIEDQLIAYTFAEYLKSDDATWPLLLPMVKSAVRAMDCVQQVVRERWSLDVASFTVCGASKRGWTTWLTGAVDKRVDALAPMVIDMLNMGPQMKHQLASWGRFSEQIQDYTARGLQFIMATPRGQALQQIVDPYQYRDALRQPKLILLGTNDRYWPLDALNLYWPGLEGEKYVLYVPNVGHGLTDPVRVVSSVSALHRQASGELELPKLSWRNEPGESVTRLVLSSDKKPQSVSIWTATASARDFREARWSSTPLTAGGQGEFAYALPRPASGYTAAFGEYVFADEVAPYYLSTTMTIVGPAGKN